MVFIFPVWVVDFFCDIQNNTGDYTKKGNIYAYIVVGDVGVDSDICVGKSGVSGVYDCRWGGAGYCASLGRAGQYCWTVGRGNVDVAGVMDAEMDGQEKLAFPWA